MAGWVWYGMLYNLADGDILKIEEIGKLNFVFVLTHLAYKKTQENYIEAKKKEMQRMQTKINR